MGTPIYKLLGHHHREVIQKYLPLHFYDTPLPPPLPYVLKKQKRERGKEKYLHTKEEMGEEKKKEGGEQRGKINERPTYKRERERTRERERERERENEREREKETERDSERQRQK